MLKSESGIPWRNHASLVNLRLNSGSLLKALAGALQDLKCQRIEEPPSGRHPRGPAQAHEMQPQAATDQEHCHARARELEALRQLPEPTALSPSAEVAIQLLALATGGSGRRYHPKLPSDAGLQTFSLN